MASRTLHVRCATWEQVHIFTTRKLRRGRLLSMKVAFAAKSGSRITLGLELPNQQVIPIEGIVHKASPVEVDGKADPNRTWIEVELTGFTDEVKARIKAASEQRDKTDDATDPQIQPIPPPRKSAIITAQPSDELPSDERTLFLHLSNELRRLRQAAVHDVLGVAADAGPDEVRARWRDLIRRNHPDLVARRNAPAITHLAEELTIVANRAYDRMRARLVADGRGTVAGSTLAAPPGWLVAFDDMQSGDAAPAPRRGPPRFERAASEPPVDGVPVAVDGQGSEAFEQRARAMLGQGDVATAREVLAAALVVYPRSKPLRSLYYIATALAALQDGEVMLATSQLETALAHHDQCTEAVKMLDHIRKHGAKRADEMQRLFR